MNWKVNYWTILFAVAGIGWLVSSTILSNKSQHIAQDAEITEGMDNRNRYKIPYDTALTRYKNFKNYAKLFNFPTSEIAKPYDTLKHEIKSKHVMNPDIRYFHLPADGISEFINIFRGLQDSINSKTYAILSLKKAGKDADSANANKEIDLMFYVDGNSLDGTDGDFYDFTTPCPDLCDPPPPFDNL